MPKDLNFPFFLGIYFLKAGFGLCDFMSLFISSSTSFPRALSLDALKPSIPGVNFPLFSLVTLLIARTNAERLLISCLCKSLTFFLLLSLLARYIRLCKLVTCLLTLFHFMDFQQVVFGFADLQISLFEAIHIICHQILTHLFTITFYMHVVHLSKVGTCFPCQNTLFCKWLWYLSIVCLFILFSYVSFDN